MKNKLLNYPSIAAALLLSLTAPFYVNAQQGSVDEVAQINKQVEELYGARRYVEAIPLAQRVLTLQEKNLGPDHADVATSLDNLAALYSSTGAHTKAEPLLQRALAIQEQVLGPDNSGIATSLSNLAGCYFSTGAYLKVEPLLQRALEIREKALGPDHPETATSLSDLTALYFSTGAYTKAEPLAQRALAIREKTLGPDHSETTAALSNLAALYFSTGAYTKAELLYERVVSIQEKTLGAGHPDTATSLNNLAVVYGRTGAYAKAEPLHYRALKIREKVFGSLHAGIATSLNNLALLYFSNGAYAKAEPLHQRALAIREKVLGPDHPDTANSLENLALLYASTGAYTKAEPLYQRALVIFETALGSEHPITAGSLDGLAMLHFSTGAFMRAIALYERAQAIGERNAALFLLSGSESRKQQYLRQMTQTVNLHVSASLSYSAVRSKALGLTSVLRYKGRVLDAMSDSIAQLRRNATPEDRTLLDELSYVAQELSALTFRSPLERSSQNNREHFDTLTQRQESLQAELSARSAAFAKALAPVTLEDVRRTLPADTVLIEWIRYQPVDPNAQPATQLRAPRYAAYVLKHTGAPVVIDVGVAEPIEDLITSFRNALTDPMTDSRGASRTGPGRVSVRKLAAQLAEKLFEPLNPHLSGSERLLISPDGALNLLPFAALVDAHGEYLAQKFEISYLTSGRDLLRIADTPARSSAVVLADPTYGSSSVGANTVQSARPADLDRSGLVFDSLPGTAAEAQALQSLLQLDAQHVLTGDRATEAQLRVLHGPQILHLATHGFFLKDEDVMPLRSPFLGVSTDSPAPPLGENPLLRSGLALAGANQRSSGDTDDGILTAAEVAQLDLLGTQLVVLSACETALGTVDAGEGVYGLRRALVLAGAQSQLVSLWKVDDAATSKLMTDYYQRLLEGEGRAAALRAVQRDMLASPSHQHPYYWAAFIPIGNWKPLSQ